MKGGVRGLGVAVCLAAALGILTVGPVSGQTTPTANLMVQLDGTSAAVGVGDNAGKVQIWYDQAFTVGNESATQQDFGVVSDQTANMPTLTTAVFPAGVKPVLDFDRGTTTKNSSAVSDYLSSKLAGETRAAFGGVFTPGADIAYDTASDGISWFTVFQTDILLQTSGSGSSQNGRQTIFRTQTSAHVDMWATAAQDTIDLGNGVDAYGQVRTTTGGAVGNVFSELTSQWYILGHSWDPFTGVFRSVLYDETGTSVSLLNETAAVNTNVGSHVMTRIGLLPTVAVPPLDDSKGSAFDGRIAEILVYDTALGEAAMGQVGGYLTAKYFVPEPSMLVLTMGLGLGALAARRRGQ